MNEATWLVSTDPDAMIRFLRESGSNRKLRLFVCSECRRREDNIGKYAFREAVEVAERYADGEASREELAAASRSTMFPRRVHSSQSRILGMVHWLVQDDDSMPMAARVAVAKKPAARDSQSRILRDIFGNPFRPLAFDPAWLTWNNAAIPRLARGIYAERAFERMSVLGDALEEAGCDNEDILQHCRSRAVHVRGCHVVDAILGKA